MEEILIQFVSGRNSAVLFFLMLAFGRPFLVFFHELGHALPGLWFTRQKVSIYLGSYGDPANSWFVRAGLLEIWFKPNFLVWKTGLCVSAAPLPSKKAGFIFILCGPVVSLATALLFFYLALSTGLPGSVKLCIFYLVLLSFFDLLINLFPMGKPIKLYDGTTTLNDGQQLLMLMGWSNLGNQIDKALDLFVKENYVESAVLLEKVLEKHEREELFRVIICALLLSEQYQKALVYHNRFEALFTLDSDDYSRTGLAKARLKLYSESLPDYDRSLELNPENANTLNNRGFTYNFLERFDDAISDFDKAILLEPEAAYPYNNRGLAKIKTGRVAEGLEDIFHSLKLDGQNAYAFRNLGIYHLDRQEFKLALENFEKAKELDPATVEINELIEKASETNVLKAKLQTLEV